MWEEGRGISGRGQQRGSTSSGAESGAQDKGWYPENKLLFLWIRSKLLPPSPQFGKLVQLFSYVKIQDREVSLELEDLEDDPQAER